MSAPPPTLRGSWRRLFIFLVPENDEMKIAYSGRSVDRSSTDGRAMDYSSMTFTTGNNQAEIDRMVQEAKKFKAEDELNKAIIASQCITTSMRRGSWTNS